MLFTSLGEASTTEITKTNDAYGMSENTRDACAGGKITGYARKALEKQTSRKVVSASNYKEIPEAEVLKQIQANKE